MLKRVREKVTDYIVKKLNNEKIIDLLDFIKFIVIHGFLGLFILLIVISITGINFTITSVIRQSPFYTITVFLIGSGAGYYMLMDISKFYSDIRGKNKR